jgi:hypothetical protein
MGATSKNLGWDNRPPRILGALVDVAAHGLAALDRIHLERLPRMADFTLWATTCQTAFWPAETFARAYAANRTSLIEGITGGRLAGAAGPVAGRFPLLAFEGPASEVRDTWRHPLTRTSKAKGTR